MYKFKYTDKWAPIAAMTVVLVVLTILRAILLALLSTSTWRLRLTSIARSITPWTRTPVYSSAHADTGDGGSECSSDSKGRRKIRPYVAAAWATLVALVAILITMVRSSLVTSLSAWLHPWSALLKPCWLEKDCVHVSAWYVKMHISSAG